MVNNKLENEEVLVDEIIENSDKNSGNSTVNDVTFIIVLGSNNDINKYIVQMIEALIPVEKNFKLLSSNSENLDLKTAFQFYKTLEELQQGSYYVLMPDIDIKSFFNILANVEIEGLTDQEFLEKRLEYPKILKADECTIKKGIFQ